MLIRELSNQKIIVMKKILFLLLGLMSLVGLSSCEDEFTYDSEKNFLPIGYMPKSPTQQELEGDEELKEVTTFQILGMRGLVFDEVEKSDWRIISPAEIDLDGTEPLKIEEKAIEIDDFDTLLDIDTNYGGIPITFGNAKLTYQYMNQEMELIPLDDVWLTVNLIEKNCQKDPFFFQSGEIEFDLLIGYTLIKRHKINFFVADPSIDDANIEK